MQHLKRNTGQFIPISAMIMFSIMVFTLAVVNVYKVSRTKLKVQNLADAAALNLASQEAQAFNVVTDRNEWLNHMTAGVPSPSDPNAPNDIRDCSAFNMAPPHDLMIPPIACVENTIDPDSDQVFSRRVWNARGNASSGTDGAIGYAMLIHTVNVAQKLFAQAYNSFLGATSGSSSNGNTTGPTNFVGLLKSDIPELDSPDVHLVAWNSGEMNLQQAEDIAKKSNSNFVSQMQPLRFKVDHDISTRYRTNKSVEPTTLGQLLYGRINYGDENNRNGPLYGQSFEAVGWMVPDTGQPMIPVQNGQGPQGNQVGVGVYVSKDVKLPMVGSITVGAKSKAYVVAGSGETGEKGGSPIFRPTYWVKLGS